MKKRVKSVMKHVASSLWRQVRAAEKANELLQESIALQKEQLELSKRTVRNSTDMAQVAKRTYADRLLAAVRASTLDDEAP